MRTIRSSSVQSYWLFSGYWVSNFRQFIEQGGLKILVAERFPPFIERYYDLDNWAYPESTNPNIDEHYRECFYPGNICTADEYGLCSDGVDNDCDGDIDSNDSDCVTTCPDADSDGYQDSSCGGNDCDDSDAGINPGASEICDDGIDNDCDGDIDSDDSDCGGGGGGGTPPSGMALIPSGCFDMGDALGEGYSQELPVHNVCITSNFYMDVHEVTNAEYEACVDAGTCTAPAYSSSFTRSLYYGNPTYDNYPVIYVDWNQATDYCTWASKRLPTEAEWEYAARGGLAGKRFPWGGTISCADANYYAKPSSYPYDTNGSDGYCIGDTSQVESYAANGYGLYDMSGNVWEWTNDWYQSDYYQYCVDNNIVDDPQGPNTGSSRVLRGGRWYNNSNYLRVAYRYYNTPTLQYNNIGFRCAGD